VGNEFISVCSGENYAGGGREKRWGETESRVGKTHLSLIEKEKVKTKSPGIIQWGEGGGGRKKRGGKKTEEGCDTSFSIYYRGLPEKKGENLKHGD